MKKISAATLFICLLFCSVVSAQRIDFQSTTLNVSENAGVVSIPVVLSNSVGGTVFVTYTVYNGTAMSGTDFTMTNTTGNVVIASPDTAGYINITIKDDALLDGNKDFTIYLSSPSPGTVSMGDTMLTVTITDDDLPIVSFDNWLYYTHEAVGTANVPIKVTGTHTAPISVYVRSFSRQALEGPPPTPGNAFDFSFVNDTFVIPVGVSSITVPATIHEDDQNDPDETFVLEITSVSANARIGFPDTVAVVIRDNDFKSNIEFLRTDTTIYEATNAPGNYLNFTLVLGDTLDSIVTVDYSIMDISTDMADYGSPTGTITFPVHSSSQTLSILIINDTMPEPTESFKVMLTNPSSNAQLNDNKEVRVTVLDNDLYKPLSVVQKLTDDVLKVYPVPASDVLYIQAGVQADLIQLVDMTGRIVHTQKPTNSLIDKTTINTENLPTGMYLLKLQAGQESISRRVQIAR